MDTQVNTRRKVTTDSLNIRIQPSASAAIVGQYLQNDIFEVVEAGAVEADNHHWQRTADGRGWVAADLTVSATVSTDPQAAFVPPAAGSGPAASGVTILSTSTTVVADFFSTGSNKSGVVVENMTTVTTVLNTPVTGTAASTANAEPVVEWPLPFHAAMRGIGSSAGGWAPEGKHLDLVKRNNVEIALIVTYESGQAARTIQPMRDVGVKHFILRAAMHEAVTTAQRFVQVTLPTLQEYANAIGHNNEILIAIHNEVNLVQEGWTKAWRDGAEFANWWRTVADAYRHAIPGAKMGFPAMSPGSDVPGIRLNEATFVQQAQSAISAADWIGVHYYWEKRDGSDINPPFAWWRQWFGNKPIIGTEVGPTDGNIVDAGAVRIAYEKFAAIGVPAMAWLLTGAGAWQNAAWDVHGIIL